MTPKDCGEVGAHPFFLPPEICIICCRPCLLQLHLEVLLMLFRNCQHAHCMLALLNLTDQ